MGGCLAIQHPAAELFGERGVGEHGDQMGAYTEKGMSVCERKIQGTDRCLTKRWPFVSFFDLVDIIIPVAEMLSLSKCFADVG